MEYNDILKELRSKLGDSSEENIRILRAEGDRYAKEGNIDGIKAAGELIMENMPEEQKEELKRLTHIDGERLDEVYNKIVEHINKKEIIEAKSLAERLYKKITVDFAEGENSVFVSLRNPFEDNLYHFLYKPEKVLNRAPFDFATYITTYAYILIETGSTIDAVPVLEKAIEYNPVDCGPKFELAEIYKIIKNKKQLLQITRDTLKVASSPIAIGRCYANVGYALTDSQEYEDAAIFYTAAAMFAPDPSIPLEMKHLADLMGKPIVPPTQQQIIDTMKKHDIEFGPDKDVISIAAQLASHYITENDIPNALQALKITYNLTLDDKVKELILKYDPKSAMLRPKPQEKPDIKQTVNNNPEE